MSEKDITEKTLEDYNDVFADIVNVLLFDGQLIVKEDELIATRARSQLKLDGSIHEQERDNVKIWQRNKFRIAMIGFENQSAVDNYEPARVLSYDGASYKEQLVEIDSCRKKRIKPPSLVPVITIVINFGKDTWKKHSLYECMDIPDFLRNYVSDYKINVISIKDLTLEQIQKFKSDFGIIANYFYHKYHDKDDIYDNRVMDHPDAVLKLMKALTGDNRFEESLNEFSEQERKGITMCELLDKIEARGEALGEALGIEKGIIIFIEDKLEDNIPDDKIIEKLRNKFDLTTEKAEEYIEKCRNMMASK